MNDKKRVERQRNNRKEINLNKKSTKFELDSSEPKKLVFNSYAD